MGSQNIESGHKIESQREQYKMTESARKIDFTNIYIPKEFITTREKNPATATLSGALLNAFKEANRRIGDKSAPWPFVDAAIRRAANANVTFSVDSVRAGDSFEIKDNFLFFTMKSGEKFRIPLFDRPLTEAEQQEQKEYTNKKSDISNKARREWKGVAERSEVDREIERILDRPLVDDLNILYTSMIARSIEFTPEERNRIWNEVQKSGSDYIATMKAYGDKRLGEALTKYPEILQEKYKGTWLQHLIMVKYLKTYGLGKLMEEVEATVKPTPKPKPEPTPTPEPVRPEPKPKPKIEPAPEPAPQPKPAPSPKPVVEVTPTPAPQPEPLPEPQPTAPASAPEKQEAPAEKAAREKKEKTTAMANALSSAVNEVMKKRGGNRISTLSFSEINGDQLATDVTITPPEKSKLNKVSLFLVATDSHYEATYRAGPVVININSNDAKSTAENLRNLPNEATKQLEAITASLKGAWNFEQHGFTTEIDASTTASTDRLTILLRPKNKPNEGKLDPKYTITLDYSGKPQYPKLKIEKEKSYAFDKSFRAPEIDLANGMPDERILPLLKSEMKIDELRGGLIKYKIDGQPLIVNYTQVYSERANRNYPTFNIEFTSKGKTYLGRDVVITENGYKYDPKGLGVFETYPTVTDLLNHFKEILKVK